MKKIPVLIVGGGPVGLSMAVALARQNVHSLIIDKLASPMLYPRSRGVSMRTMELFQQWGNVDELLKYEFPKEALRFIWAQSLQGEEVVRNEIKDMHLYSHGPIKPGFVTQDWVEKYLRDTLESHDGAPVQFSKEMISFTQEDDGVIVKVLNKETNQHELIHAQYVVAADGANSFVRRKLDIEMEGPENLGQYCNIYCEFDIAKWTEYRPSLGYFFTEPELTGCSLLTTYGKNRWIIAIRFTEQTTRGDFTQDYCIEKIRHHVGIPDLNVKILNKSFWTMGAQTAKQYRHKRIFLVGDAAHRIPPTGGLGMNTGVQDAHNLAWKLAFVLNHHVSDTLLDTYYDERAPIANRNIQWSMKNAERFIDIGKAINSGDFETLKILLDEQQEHLKFEGLDLGFIYHSNAVASESEQGLSVAPAKYIATTLPGSRAPYMKLIKNNKAIHTLELFEKTFVLLVGSDGESWRTAANELAQTLSFPLTVYSVGPEGDLVDPENNWHTIYEVTKTGCVLVRPDGHVAWRSQSFVDNSKRELQNIAQTIIGE